ncbi:MAG: prephenate dehydratase, partial [Staphylococcus aureus]
VQADSAITTDIKKVIAILETLDFKVEMIGAFN